MHRIQTSQSSVPSPAFAGVQLCVLLGALGILLLLSQMAVSSFFSWIALLYYCALCWFVIRYFPAAFVLLLWFIFIRLTTMISGVAIETGGFMPEFLMNGYPTGGFVRLAAVYTAGILGGAFILNTVMRLVPENLQTTPTEKFSWHSIVFLVVLALCLWAILIGIQNGFPALESVDRIVYWKKVSNRFLYFFLGNRPIFALLLGLIYSVSPGWKKQAALLIFILVLVISLLFAEKFTSICMILFAFATPIFLRSETHLKTLTTRLIPLGVILSIITMPAVLIAYGALEDFESAKAGLKVRATSQAEIWFMADQDQENLFSVDHAGVEHNIAAIISNDPESLAQSPPYLGARYYMARHLDALRYEHYLYRGVTLTMATEGYLLHLFGWLGMLAPYLFLIAVYCLYQTYLYFAVMAANPLRLIVAGKLLVWADFSLNQGYVWFLIGIKSLALVAFIAFVEMIIHAARKRTRNVNFSAARMKI